MSTWTIRLAEVRDAGPLRACIDAAYEDARSRIQDLPAVSEGIETDIRQNVVWVAEFEGAVVGGLVLILKEDFALLANVAVDPVCSGLGIGKALMTKAEQDCRAREIYELRLSTHTDMPENVSLYKHLGWTETGRSENKVQMSKHL